MATGTYSVLPVLNTGGFSKDSDPYQRRNQETYGSNIETVTPHPYQTAHGSQIPDRQRYSYNSNSDYSSTLTAPPFNQHQFNQSSTGFGQPSTVVTKRADNPQLNKKNKNDPNAIKRSTTQVTSMKNKENQLPSNKTQTQVVTRKKNIEPLQQSITRHAPENSSKVNEPNLVRSEQFASNPPAKRTVPTTHKVEQPVHRHQSPPAMDQRTKPTHSHHQENVEPVKKSLAPVPVETENQAQKPNRSSLMRAAAIKKLEQKREQKRQDAFFPSSENKIKQNKSKPSETTPETDVDYEDGRKTKTTKRIVRSHSYDRHRHHHSDVEHSEDEKVKPKKKHAHSVPRTRQTAIQNDDDQSEAEKIKSKQKKSKSFKKTNTKHQPPSDDEDDNMDKSKKSRKPSKKRLSRRDEHHNESSDDQQKHRSKSRKRTVVPDGHDQLPPIRRQGAGPIHPEHYRDRLRRGQPYFDEFYPPYGLYPSRYDLHHHLHEDAYDVPPYLAPYHDPYDPFFDYEKRKTQMKKRRDKNNSRTDRESNGTATGYETERDERTNSNEALKHKKTTHKKKSNGRKSRPEDTPSRRGTHVTTHYYPEDAALDLWRQERNDYLKGKFKPTVHDVLYAQQWMKADSYLENQRRRQLRDAQGFYFPYKKYTLKDYKDLQKSNVQNLYGDDNQPIIDRKQRAKKRQEYGQQIERQVADNPGIRQIPQREMEQRRPWHVSTTDPPDSDRASRRERALEYAKDQVKYRPINGSQYVSEDPDSSRHPRSKPINNDHHERTRKFNQSYENDDDY